MVRILCLILTFLEVTIKKILNKGFPTWDLNTSAWFPDTMDSILLAIPAFILGIIFLYKGSDILVDGTSKTACQLGISAMIISVVLVGFGTSAPEFAISVGAAIQNDAYSADISLGNIIGSCVANLLLVLGLSAVIRPITVKKQVISRELLVVLAATLILLGASFFGLLDQYHVIGGVLFLLSFAVCMFFFFRCAQKERIKDIKCDKGDMTKNILFIILGIAGVVAGAYLLIDSSVTIALFLGIHPLVIALTLVAVGTSLPELVVSIIASWKKESDIAVGNVLGSNVFNILLILGFAALFLNLNAAASFDLILILLGVTLLMFPLLSTGKTITRWEGVLFLIIYAGFIVYLSPVVSV
jgi:cation:H+ antiporter